LRDNNTNEEGKMIYMVIRDGKIQTQVNATINNTGEVWCGGCPMIDSKSTGYTTAGEAAIRAICKNHKYDQLPVGVIAHIGVNPSGLRIVEQSVYLAERAAEITPAQKERAEINNLYYRAKKIQDSSSEDNVSGPMILRGRADKMYADWCKKYPADAAQEQKDKMKRKAENLRDMARGALTYDCDGSLSQADQQKRHDAMMNQAEEIEAAIK